MGVNWKKIYVVWGTTILVLLTALGIAAGLQNTHSGEWPFRIIGCVLIAAIGAGLILALWWAQ